LALFRQVGSPYGVVNLLQDLVSALTAQGRFDEAAIYLNEALATGRRLGAPKLLAGVLNNLGWLHYIRGEYRQSLALYEEGLAAAQRGDDLQWRAYISVGMADLHRDVGAYERAESLYNASWQIAQESEPGLAFYTILAQADMARWQGKYACARGLLRQARQLTEAKELDFEKRGPLPVAEGITLAESGEIETGIRFLSDGARFLEQQQAKHELARAQFLLAKAYFIAGNKPQATMKLRQAIDLANHMGAYQFTVAEGQHAEDLLRLGIAAGVGACRDIVERIQQLRTFREGQIQLVAGAEEDTMSRIEIYALGEGRVVRDGHPVSSSEWQAAMAKELFFYILLHGPLERDAIGVVFWPNLSAKNVTSNFHNALYRVRRALSANAIVVDDGQYSLGDVDYWFDIEEFEALVERARLLPPHDWQAEDLWRRAVALYGGDFLPEVERVWCVPQREALREMYVEGLIGVGQCHETRREFEGAITWYRRAMEMDNLREDIHQNVMRCYSGAGRRSEALAQYHYCREILKQELDIEPSVEMRRLYDQIAEKKRVN
jgi:two-component SAPR family response regulator/Tfp pilus assembly protein PilF